MPTGKVKFFNRKKGFGYIVTDESGNEIFFHASGIVNKYDIKEEVRVSFEEISGERGPAAVNVQKMQD